MKKIKLTKDKEIVSDTVADNGSGEELRKINKVRIEAVLIYLPMDGGTLIDQGYATFVPRRFANFVLCPARETYLCFSFVLYMETIHRGVDYGRFRTFFAARR